MKKDFYESPFVSVIELEEKDIVTVSEGNSDDLGGWHEDWFGSSKAED